jgi:hypothetical protein
MSFVLIICDVPIACSVGKASDLGVSVGVCLSCKDSKAIPMMVEEFERIICVVSWIEDVISYFVRVICSPMDDPFDAVWKIVFCSSGDSSLSWWVSV